MNLCVKVNLPTEGKRRKGTKSTKIKQGELAEVNLVRFVETGSQTSENPGTSNSEDFTGAIVRRRRAQYTLPGTSSASSSAQNSRNLCSCCHIHLDEIKTLRTKQKALESSLAKLQIDVLAWQDLTTKLVTAKQRRRRSASSGRNRRSLIRKSSPPKSPPPSPTGTVEIRHSPIPASRAPDSQHDSQSDEDSRSPSSSDGESSCSSRTNVTVFNCGPNPNNQQLPLVCPPTPTPIRTRNRNTRRESPQNAVSPSPSPSRTPAGLIESDDTLPCRTQSRRKRRRSSQTVRTSFATPSSTNAQSERIELDLIESDDPFPCNDTISSLPEDDVESKPGMPTNSEDEVSVHDLESESESDESAFVRREIRNQKRIQKRHESKLKCGYCSAAFPYPYELKRHLRRHTREKPFACTECPARFAQKHHLTRHTATQHKKMYTPAAERKRRAEEAAAAAAERQRRAAEAPAATPERQRRAAEAPATSPEKDTI